MKREYFKNLINEYKFYLCVKFHFSLLMTSQDSSIRQILDTLYCIRNFHIYKGINIARLNDFIQRLNLNFHLTLENMCNHALNTLAEYDHNNPINMKRPKTGLRLNILLQTFSCVNNP